MKKILLVLIAVVFIGSLSFAAEPSAKPEETKTLTGKIEFIRPVRVSKRRPPKWRYAILTVVTDSGETAVIYVIRDTVVTDTSGKDLSEGGEKFGAFSLKKGQRIEVKYLTVERGQIGQNEALSVRCLD